METLIYAFRKLLYGLPLVLGVTLISFVLMVYFGPDKTYDLLGKNATTEQIQEIRHQLGYDRPFLVRYGQYMKELITLDFGNSDSSGEKVSSIFARTVPVTFALSLPGFILGELLAIAIALLAAFYRGKWQDKVIMTLSVIGMSISLLIIVIAFQVIFCSTYGLNLFPVNGWSTDTWTDYFLYVTVPTLVTVFVSLGYNARFFRAVVVEEMGRDHVRTALAYGCPPRTLLFKHVLKNCMVPIITRTVFSIPYLFIGGSLVVEGYFGIPGIGLSTYQAITSGDQPLMKALVGVTAVAYVLCLILTDVLYQVFDPRISLK
jgi:peptide/nickel transport system permease protein